MDALKRNITWTCAGLMLALTAGAPALADDTELLLVTPATAQNNKPNILFILDTSGSMDTEELTTVPYDSNQDYTIGDCDIDRMYFTDVSTVPDCATSNQYIDDDNFFCDAAINPVSGIGSYAGVLVQYRDGGNDGTGSGPKKWQTLAAGYNSEPVECQADDGIHGDGDASRLWASNGTNLNQSDIFANSATGGISWGSAPRNRDYTVYDGNYLNWRATPATANIERIDIVKSVVSAVMTAITNVNVGIQRFNRRDGGPIIQGLVDIGDEIGDVLDTDRASNHALGDSDGRAFFGRQAEVGCRDRSGHQRLAAAEARRVDRDLRAVDESLRRSSVRIDVECHHASVATEQFFRHLVPRAAR